MLDACLERVTRHRHFYALTLGFCRQMISRMRTSSSDMSVAMVDKKKYSATGPSILSRDGGRSSASGGDHHERFSSECADRGGDEVMHACEPRVERSFKSSRIYLPAMQVGRAYRN